MKTIPGHCTSVQQYNSNRLSGKQVVHQSKKIIIKGIKKERKKRHTCRDCGKQFTICSYLLRYIQKNTGKNHINVMIVGNN